MLASRATHILCCLFGAGDRGSGVEKAIGYMNEASERADEASKNKGE